MPSSVHAFCAGGIPLLEKYDCDPVSDPPTFTRSICVPGIDWITAHGSRAVGMRSSSRLPTLAPTFDRRMSSSGVSAVTFTDSARPAIFSTSVTSTLCLEPSASPPR